MKEPARHAPCALAKVRTRRAAPRLHWFTRPRAGTRFAGWPGERIARASPPPRARRIGWPLRRTRCGPDRKLARRRGVFDQAGSGAWTVVEGRPFT